MSYGSLYLFAIGPFARASMLLWEQERPESHETYIGSHNLSYWGCFQSQQRWLAVHKTISFTGSNSQWIQCATKLLSGCLRKASSVGGPALCSAWTVPFWIHHLGKMTTRATAHHINLHTGKMRAYWSKLLSGQNRNLNKRSESNVTLMLGNLPSGTKALDYIQHDPRSNVRYEQKHP
jgi:hypothetical protein